jgi:ketosteroid isomerase-like protein
VNDTEQLLHRFYEAFQKKDHKTMASCYHTEVTFGDPAFPRLEGWRASAMWMMLCERGKDLELEFRDIEADDTTGKAFWEAHYTFGKTGLKVHNKIDAAFKFRDGLIIEHRDTFDMRKWMGMALGFKGKILGLFPPGQKVVQKTAMGGLELFIEKKRLGPDDFPNGARSS